MLIILAYMAVDMVDTLMCRGMEKFIKPQFQKQTWYGIAAEACKGKVGIASMEFALTITQLELRTEPVIQTSPQEAQVLIVISGILLKKPKNLLFS